MAELIVSKNQKIFFRIALSGHSLTIGRSAQNDITLPDEDISRQHAEIIKTNDDYLLKDLSRVGTQVNGEGMTERTLSDGDVITIGSWSLAFASHSKALDDQHQEIQTCITRVQSESKTKILKVDDQGQTLTSEKPTLQIGRDGAPFEIKDFPFIIGSNPQSDLVIEDDYVSARHCQIKQVSNQFFVEDLTSTNGTFIGGHQIQNAALVQPTEFVIGKTHLFFNTENIQESILPEELDQFCGLVGKSDTMHRLFSLLKKIAPTDHDVFIQGETGTGKELVARALHALSNRSQSAYLVLNCGAISANLIESELFGHEKGAFTGAHAKRVGAFEAANGGTLFLDEIGELPIELQPKLLRALENRSIRRVGSNHEISVDLRVIAASHRNLLQRVKDGLFREDLYYRLHVIPITLPPLRKRPEDIPLLASYILGQSASEGRKQLSLEALEKLARYEWPGNVRELKNVLLRALIFSEESVIKPEDLEISENAPPQNLSQLKREKIMEVLQKTKGNKTHAANMLGIAKSTLFKKIKEYEI